MFPLFDFNPYKRQDYYYELLTCIFTTLIFWRWTTKVRSQNYGHQKITWWRLLTSTGKKTQMVSLNFKHQNIILEDQIPILLSKMIWIYILPMATLHEVDHLHIERFSIDWQQCHLDQNTCVSLSHNFWFHLPRKICWRSS